jgi:hypothetical protein
MFAKATYDCELNPESESSYKSDKFGTKMNKPPLKSYAKRPFPCPVCFAKLEYPSLEEHFLKIHMGERAFCVACQKSFSDPDEAQMHFLIVHDNLDPPETFKFFPDTRLATFFDGKMHCKTCAAILGECHGKADHVKKQHYQ